MANYTELESEVTGLVGVLGVLIDQVKQLFTDNLIGFLFVIAILSLILWFVAWIRTQIQNSTKNMKMR